MQSKSFAIRRRRLLAGLSVAVFLGVIIFSAVTILELRRNAIEALKTESGRLGIVLAEQTTRALQSADIDINEIAARIASKGISNIAGLREAFGTRAVFESLQRLLVNLPQVESFAIVDAEGHAVNVTRAWPIPTGSIADRRYYIYHADNNDLSLQVSEPMRNRIDGTETFYLSRRINAPDGSFLGIVNASMRISYFKDLYQNIGFDEGSAITFIRKDGTIILRYPRGTSVSGQKLPQFHPFYDAVNKGGSFYGTGGLFDSNGALFVSVNPLRTYPVVIDIVRAEWQALAQWRQQALKIGIGCLCALMTQLAILFALNQQFVSLERARSSIDERTEALTQSASELAAQAHVLQSTLDNMNEGLFMIDASGHVAVYNNRVLELLGLPVALMESKPTFKQIGQFQHNAGEFDTMSDALRLLFSNNHLTTASQSYERERPNGTILEIRSVKLPDGGMVRTYTDVTQNRRQAARMREVQRLESLGRLSGGIAHDFNNLLAAISLNAEMLASELGDEPERQHLANVILTAVESGSGLIQRLLAYSREQALAPQPLDLASYLVDQIELVRRTIGDNITVIAEIEPDLPPVEVDPSQVGDALLNVAINARDAMPNGGRLLIRAYRDNQSPDRETGFVVLAVTDTGTGMSAETISHATEPFFTTKPFGRGTGLGLSMVDGFVRQSGGQLRIESAPGKGTTIFMSLPCSCGTPATSSKPVVEVPQGRERLLVVDDNAAVRETLSRILSRLDYDVSVASNGPEAMLRLASSGPFGLLLTDLAMPDGMSGRELVEQVRRRWPKMPTLLMSGNAETDAEDTSSAASVSLKKPFSRHELAKAVRLALDSATAG